MKASVIFSTYNSEEWLEKVIIGFSVQTVQDFEIIIADDGSRQATADLIAALRTEIPIPIVHVWQEDNGFQKSQILNKAIVASSSDYLIFTDGDCIPRRDFVATHLANREPGYFLSGGYFKLPMTISKAITKEDIQQQRCFDLKWLRNQGLPSSYKNIKFIAKGFWARLLNAITPTNASWNGHNASGWKKDLVAVNGFNQDMQYGGQDRELGERLFNLGLRSKQIRYSAICVHLDHKRGYVNEETWTKNYNIRKNTRENKVVRTPNGIDSNTL
ncbi:glycosyltransferase family 2 protein [Flavobacterium sedimenticola]|uniref:Glycosyltransferase family 2 protein n=1 Tax=Flavobacterium sedimenticola TaxID=3043286 RepID=A0ABT6XRC1_9FLAO|nr:glycosyltransferase family 2 protein [Flavobacterium sedimenticola]MDI9257568.1 glycosyltransferase family 2 protein [Flavobacterium sedimenticola]